MSKMIKVYRQILDTANVHITDDDCVSLKEAQKDGEVKHIPLTIKGQRLVLPTPVQMRNSDWEKRVAFHPLSENTGRGESAVLERLRGLFAFRVNTVYPLLLLRLLQIGASPKDHEKLTPEQAEFLPLVKDADEKTIQAFAAICKETPATNPLKSFISLYLRRSAKLEGKDYFRAGVLTFPLYAEMMKGEEKVAGVALRKKDRKTLKDLMDYVLPHQGDAQYYSRGSNSRVAPSIDAVMNAMLAIAGPLNDVIERFDGLIPQDLLIPTEWAETFENVESMTDEIRNMPMLRGNEGHHPEALAKAAAIQEAQAAQGGLPSAAAQPARVMGLGQPIGIGGMGQGYPQHQPLPSAAQAPMPVSSGGRGTNLSTLMRSQGFNPSAQQQQQHGWQQQPFQQGSSRATLSNPTVSNGWGHPPQQNNGWGFA